MRYRYKEESKTPARSTNLRRKGRGKNRPVDVLEPAKYLWQQDRRYKTLSVHDRGM